MVFKVIEVKTFDRLILNSFIEARARRFFQKQLFPCAIGLASLRISFAFESVTAFDVTQCFLN
jgi:hypothetical protein